MCGIRIMSPSSCLHLDGLDTCLVMITHAQSILNAARARERAHAPCIEWDRVRCVFSSGQYSP